MILKLSQFKKGGENFCLNGEAFLVAFFVKGEKEFPARHRHYKKKRIWHLGKSKTKIGTMPMRPFM